MTPSKHEKKLLEILAAVHTNILIETEFRFCPERRWRFDFAYPSLKVAFEVEGGIWNHGRHIHPVGFQKDCEKYNEAAKLGWKVFRLTPEMISLKYIRSLI